jgi:Secretion system C-terminal sorting domain
MKKISLALSLFLMFCLPTNISAQVQAIKSDNFVARIGVNTHFNYTDLPYVTNFAGIKNKLGQLGIRYYRDAPDPDDAANIARVKDLYNTHGMKMEAIFPGGDITAAIGFNPGLVAPLIDRIKNNIGTQYFLNMEGLNEPDNFNNNNDANWPANARAVQQAIFNKMKSDPAWANVPVLGPSVAAGGSYAPLGNLMALTDKGNLHWYPSGIQPSHQEFNYYEYHYDQATTNNYTDGRPLLLTETGYSNAGGTQSCSEKAAAKYIPRTFMYFLYVKGMEKVFSYELLNEGNSNTDPEKNFGLLRNDLSEKPSFTSLKNTITLLKEPGVNFTPGQLNYTLSGNMTNIYQKLFQKSNGKYYLVIWQEAKSYTIKTKKDIVVPDRVITLNFNSTIGTVKTYRPAPSPIGNGLTAINTYTNPTAVNLSVPDQLLIVEITPASATAQALAINNETENIADAAIGIYPNPAANYTTVNLGKMVNNEKVYVDVLDLSGKRIYQSGKLATTTLQLNTSKYAKGTYIIKITKGMETVNRKLVIQ